MTDMTIGDLQHILDDGGSRSNIDIDITTSIDEVVEKIVADVEKIDVCIGKGTGPSLTELVGAAVVGTDIGTETDKNDKCLDELLVPKKIELYDKLLKRILNSCTIKKNGLDMYYERLSVSNSVIQTSVIVLSAMSTFIQSLSEDTVISAYVPITTLCITSYSGLILAVAKYFKFEELKENVHNLRDRFSELHSRIKYYKDLIEPWSNVAHYKHFNEAAKYDDWTALISEIETEYNNIIDMKKELFASYEKIIDTGIARKYDVLFLYREVNHIRVKGRLERRLEELEAKYNITRGECLDTKEKPPEKHTHKHNNNHIKNNKNNYMLKECAPDYRKSRFFPRQLHSNISNIELDVEDMGTDESDEDNK